MKRREFIAATAALLVSPRRSRAQGTRRRLGVLALGPIDDIALLDGLRNRGWIDGRNLIIEYRRTQSQDHLPALAAELVALSPDLLITAGPQAALALKSATATIPIVFVGVADPVGLGLVQSLSRPGGNITGLATLVPGLSGLSSKTIETLREIVPAASKIAVLVNPGNPMHRLIVAEELPRAAQQLGVALLIVDATTAEELEIAFASAASQHADAISVFGDALTFRYATQVTALAAKHRLPAMYLSRIFVTRGGLISYGPDFADLYFRVGGYVDKILKGAKPSDLPVEQPTKFQLAINMKTAKALGLTVPPSLLARADEVIE
jgi:putative tryptophan/tyrosine transport system substrate-binding protein